ncbi:HD domain-containing protein [Roseimicrobium sp. ORNL1]|uniref:HD domain-containing protein n=1 Tax=Roseimicrobium sp. ORNL1 TaxID=2711231 RepID=UPI0013E1CA09|nr:HD domain-containing protein [Roseimicrobium sp. ORNL1]QIF00156.1 HD domain-containing protein [Roseimicrobium sp. ORNL1]
MPASSNDFEWLTLRQLKGVASATPEPWCIRVQIENLSVREASNGKPYYELKLNDGTESLVWRVFDSSQAYLEVTTCKRGGWIEVAAHWADGKFGLEPRNASLRPLAENEIQMLLAGDDETRDRQKLDYETITNLTSQLADPRLRMLCGMFLQQHGTRFQRAAAARDYHHARRGGLVEHVAQMMRTAVQICVAYPALNRDLLVSGVLFHDCGKLWENNYSEDGFTMPYTLTGEMIGHIAMGLEVVNKLWRTVMDSPESASWTLLEPPNELVRLHLLHLIGSHHGEMQFGSPVLPKTPEAIALHYIDNLDAKMEMFRRGYETSAELADGIYERVRPLPANLIRPLASVPPPVPAASSVKEENEEGDSTIAR